MNKPTKRRRRKTVRATLPMGLCFQKDALRYTSATAGERSVETSGPESEAGLSEGLP